MDIWIYIYIYGYIYMDIYGVANQRTQDDSGSI